MASLQRDGTWPTGSLRHRADHLMVGASPPLRLRIAAVLTVVVSGPSSNSGQPRSASRSPVGSCSLQLVAAGRPRAPPSGPVLVDAVAAARLRPELRRRWSLRVSRPVL